MRIRSLISSSVGNILEWYDFGLFAIYSTLFSRLFFPSDDPHTALLTTLSVFAVGFLCRPLGGLLFGYLGDRTGRVKTLRLSILMISIPTLLVGCLPTYDTIGIWAPILLVIIRIWQGISLGGEFSGNLIYLMETAPKQRRGVTTSLAATGANMGILLAALVSMTTCFFLTDAELSAWGWRIPYVFSGLFCLFLYVTRLRMEETPVFHYLQTNNLLTHNPIQLIFKNNIPHIFKTMGLLCMGSTFYYLCFIYMPVFLQQNLQLPLSVTTRLITFFIATMIILVPLGGVLSDYFGRRRMLLFNAVFISLLVVPGFYFLSEYYAVITVLILFTIASSLEQATTSVAVVENYPVPARYTGLSFSYNIGVAIFGGTTPLVCEWLMSKTQMTLIPAFYIVIAAVLTGFVAFFFVNEVSEESCV